MNALSLAPQSESKDIKLSSKKVADSKDEEGKDFFENLISNLISEEGEEGNKNFLLSKLLNLSSEFEKKEEILSNFSDGELFTDNQIGQVTIQDLLKITMSLKEGEDIAEFPTDSKSLKLALLKPDVKEQLKDAKSIKDILDIAKKNNIEVKNFQFFKEEAALTPQDKKMVQKIKSEEIFKLIEKQVDTKAKLTNSALNSPKELTAKPTDTKTNILQSVLASTELNKQKPEKVETKEVKTVSNEIKTHVPSKEEKKEIIKEVKTVLDNKKINTAETKEPKTLSNKIEVNTEKSIENKNPKTVSDEIKTHVTSKVEKKEVKTILDDKKINTAETKEPKRIISDIKEERKVIKAPINDTKTDIQTAKTPKLVESEIKIQNTKETKPVKNESKSFFEQTQTLESTKEQNQQLKTTLQQAIKPQQENREIQTTQKVEPLSEKAEKLETSETKEVSDKTTVTHESKTHQVEKSKESTDVKKTFSTFAQEFKEKVESYKPPLMKIKMELKPAGLGEVDVTLLNRGNNLQVNINSNSSTIAMFLQNQAEFKNSLVNMGFSDLQMNFGDNQKKEQDAQNQKNGKNVFDLDDIEEEQDGFEMIIPRYV